MSGRRIKHRFGGVWTEIKLKALTEYLDFYQNALKNQGFETWYIDAFAGTGDRHAELQQGGIFAGAPVASVEVVLDGSARKALKIKPAFRHYWFAEQHRGRAEVLKGLRDEFGLNIAVATGEANEAIQQLFAGRPWSGGAEAGRQRGVVFLDPYGLSVDWRTLEVLAQHKVDVWYLFPRAAVIQQLANDLSGVEEAKRKRLDQIFGGADWLDEFYQATPAQAGLFDPQPTVAMHRVASPEQIAAFARKRFGKLFCYVSDPLPLMVKGHDYFELYCLSNNPPAIALIRRGVEHVRGKYAPASRRRSALPRGGQ